MSKIELEKMLNSICLLQQEQIKQLVEEKTSHLQNLIDKTTNYYLKTLAKNGSMPDEAVEMFNLLEENIK